MGVCCIGFDNDGMFDFFNDFFVKILCIFFFSFHVFFAFYAISNIFRKTKFRGGGGGVKQFREGGGGGVHRQTLLFHFMFSSRFMLFL